VCRDELLVRGRASVQGALGEDKSFYFRGPANALNLRAQNLTIFMQMADGVDNETWLHHLRRTTIRAGCVKRSRTTSWRMNSSRSRVSRREIREQPDARCEKRSSPNTRRPRPRTRIPWRTDWRNGAGLLDRAPLPRRRERAA
jgi:hypothetical protein